MLYKALLHETCSSQCLGNDRADIDSAISRLITMFRAICGFGARQTSWEDYRWMVNHGRFSFFRLMYPLS
jgi:hypothetical protein